MKNRMKYFGRFSRSLFDFVVASPFLILAASSFGAHPLDSLELRYPLPVFEELTGAAYGNGTWVVVGDDGTVLTSTDTTSWQVGNAGTTLDLNDVQFLNNMFVAVGSGSCFTSTDGLAWTETASGLGNVTAGITFGDGLYVVAGTSGNLRTSPDLSGWTVQDPGHTTHFYGITFAAGRFVAVGNSGTITQGAVGEDWITTNPTGSRLNDVVYGNNLFVASGHGGTIVTSPDGVTWTDQGSIGGTALFSIQYGDGVFVASGNYAGTPPYAIHRSTNGTDWSGVDFTRLDQFIDYGGYGNGQFVLLATQYILTSSDGTTWDFASDPPMFVPKVVGYVNGRFIGMGSSLYGSVGYSDDGTTWTDTDSSSTGFTGTHIDATAAAGLFVVAGRQNSNFEGYIITTPNGTDWSLAYSTGEDLATRGGIYGVDHVNGHFVACGERGRILFSSDGADWVEKRFDMNGPWFRAITYGSGRYVAVGTQGTVYTSTDGDLWEPQDSGGTLSLSDVAFHNGLFVAVSNSSLTMISSPDGITWTPIGTSPPFFPSRITVVNGEFIVPGLTSVDGVTWEPRDFGGDVVFTGTDYFTFGGAIYSAPVNGVTELVIDSIARQNGDIVIEWTSGGVLQSRPGFGAGDWGDVNGASSPHQFDPSANSIEVFRLRSE